MNSKCLLSIEGRKSGIELLRIIAILMVVCLHRMGHKTLYSASKFSLSYYILWFVEIFSYKAVDIFFIISGYFSIKQKIKIRKLLIFEIIVLFYCLLSHVLCIVFGYYTFTFKTWVRVFLPWLGNHYWYYTVYFSLMILTPWLNKFIISINKRWHLTLILLITGISTLSIGDAFNTIDGYSVIWAINLYLIGAYIMLYITNLPSVKLAILLSSLCTAFVYVWFVIVGRITYTVLGQEIFSTHFMTYRQLPIVMSSIFTVIAFIQIDFIGKIKNIIFTFSSCTFGIYLLHSCLFMDHLFWIKLFPAKDKAVHSWYWLYVISTILIMYFTCFIIEYCRRLLFTKIEKSLIFDKIENLISQFAKKVLDTFEQISG